VSRWLTVCAGFLSCIVNTSGRRVPLSLRAAAHGLTFFAWLIIFFVQARFIPDRRIYIHKQTGMAALVVAGAMIPLGYATCLSIVRRGFDLGGDLQRRRTRLTR
jgi:hypothetical protein